MKPAFTKADDRFYGKGGYDKAVSRLCGKEALIMEAISSRAGRDIRQPGGTGPSFQRRCRRTRRWRWRTCRGYCPAPIGPWGGWTARRILLMREEHRNLITGNLGYAAGNAHRVLETLFERPIMAVKDVAAITGTTYAAANQLVKRMEGLGLLEEITGQARNRRFQYGPYIRLFSDEEDEAAAVSGEEVQT